MVMMEGAVRGARGTAAGGGESLGIFEEIVHQTHDVRTLPDA